ncbi:protein containing Signal transduction response regulator, receiver region [gut metagenome]|uniref:Protein containing Signal transduction response regulator, receiver region n=1 Tax=gut metagenome TaxID=749906 RepID=J9GZR6_9ZZZZ
MLSKIFQNFYTVITAANGKEGLEKVRTETPDIVLSDIIMPEMSGTELCQAIKKDVNFCHIPIVLLTARTSAENIQEGLRMGADDYITKPFNVNILVSRCNNLINNRLMLQEKFSKQQQTNMQMLATNVEEKEFIDKATEIIQRELKNGNFTVDQLAMEMGIARTKLFTKFKSITGQPPGELIMTIRLKHAAYLLQNHPELNISEVSDLCGFNIPKYFSKCFKEKYNMAPMTYRKEYTLNHSVSVSSVSCVSGRERESLNRTLTKQ